MVFSSLHFFLWIFIIAGRVKVYGKYGRSIPVYAGGYALYAIHIRHDIRNLLIMKWLSIVCGKSLLRVTRNSSEIAEMPQMCLHICRHTQPAKHKHTHFINVTYVRYYEKSNYADRRM